MAGLTSDDRPMTNGAVEGPQGSTAASSQTLGDEQTLADSDQTLSDADQTSADSDQTNADCDQLASDRDQEASDRDLASGADADTHDASQGIRERSAQRRDQTARARMQTGERRDETASARDIAALARDRAADARDRAIAQHELAEEETAGPRALSGTDNVIRASGRRRRAAQHYAQAAEYRALAAEDRQAAAQDREQAARDRLHSATERTGARAQPAFDHELDGCRRTSGGLVIAVVEFAGSDPDGQGPSGEMVERVVALVSAQLRSYDVVMRLDDDRLMCAMSDMTVANARERFTAIATTIADTSDAAAIRTGYAEVAPDEPAVGANGHRPRSHPRRRPADR